MPETFYIDFDGTIASSRHDNEFKERISKQGFEEAIRWYDSVEVDDLVLNYDLLNKLEEMKKTGARLILWTNRGDNQIGMTKRNLGDYIGLFDEMIFYGGKKSKAMVDGVIYDNEDRFANNGTGFVKIEFE